MAKFENSRPIHEPVKRASSPDEELTPTMKCLLKVGVRVDEFEIWFTLPGHIDAQGVIESAGLLVGRDADPPLGNKVVASPLNLATENGETDFVEIFTKGKDYR